MAAVPQAGFLATGGYHHHIGVNTWFSRGAPLEPADGPGLDAVVAAVDEDPGLETARARLEAAGAPVESANGSVVTRTPDGIRVVLEPEGGQTP
jgi:catechol 2,3-dioxygenase